MSAPILATKLYIPPPRPGAVPRPRLLERLNEGLRQDQGFARKLTLISALPVSVRPRSSANGWPLSSRIEPKLRVAWLSLEEGDSNPARFLAYFIAALQTIVADFGAGVLVSLQAPQPPPIEVILTALLNEIAAIPADFVLVLDDYHLVDSQQVDQAVAFLVEHLPPQMHLAIATREDPQLPLARLRGRGQLTELRAADLRFTPAEAAEFLNQVMGLNLSAEDIAALEDAHRRLDCRSAIGCARPARDAAYAGTLATGRASSTPSPAAITSCWIICWKRCWSSSPRASRPSCCAPPSSTACAVRCVRRS